MIFTLHDLTDFYIERVNVERVTAHRIKINDHSCFHNLWPNSKTKPTLLPYSVYRANRLDCQKKCEFPILVEFKIHIDIQMQNAAFEF